MYLDTWAETIQRNAGLAVNDLELFYHLQKLFLNFSLLHLNTFKLTALWNIYSHTTISSM